MWSLKITFFAYNLLKYLAGKWPYQVIMPSFQC